MSTKLKFLICSSFIALASCGDKSNEATNELTSQKPTQVVATSSPIPNIDNKNDNNKVCIDQFHQARDTCLSDFRGRDRAQCMQEATQAKNLCQQGGGEPEGFLTSIQSETNEGIEGSSFQLEAATSRTLSGASYQWTTSDGRNFNGLSPTITFDTEGVYSVNLKVTDATGVSSESDVTFIVREANDPTPDVFGMADRLSDFDDDGQVNLADFLKSSQFVSGLVPVIDRPTQLVADLNLDSDFSQEDFDLLGQAIFDEAILPSTILEGVEPRPLSVINVVSPSLLDPNSRLSVTVGGVQNVSHTRTVLGYITLIIPDNVSPGNGQLVSISDQNGVLVEYEIDILPKVTPTITGGETIQAVSDNLAALGEEGAVLLEEEYNDPVMGAFIRENNETITRQLAIIATELNKPGNEALLDTVTDYLYANGFEEQLNSLITTKNSATSQKVSGEQVCSLVDGICAQRSTYEKYEGASNFASFVCQATAVAGVAIAVGAATGVTGGAGALPAVPAGVIAAVTIITTACIPLEGALALNQGVYELLKDLDFKFELESQDNGEGMYNLNPQVLLIDRAGLCGAVSGGGSGKAESLISEKLGDVVKRLIKKKIPGYGPIDALMKKIGGKPEETVDGLFESAANLVLDKFGLASTVTSNIAQLCTDAFGGGSGGLTATAALSTISFPNDQGTITEASDGTGDFTCSKDANGAPVSEFVDITATKKVCNGETITKTEKLSCGGTTTVGITFGDNGSLVDDIFEVNIEGQSFTTNGPVTSQSFSIDLPTNAEIDVIMRGLAAPDDVGTYFISFTNATVLSGQTSGGDLNAGTTKQLRIKVQ